MAKDKKSSKAAVAAAPVKTKGSSKPIEKVQAGRVTKSDKKSSKDAAKKTAKVVEKKSKKKDPTPEPSSDSESESDADSSASSDSSDDDETTTTKREVNGKAKAKAPPQSESSTSDSDSESKDEAPKMNGAAKASAKKADSSSESDSDSDEEPAPKKSEKKVNGKTAAPAKEESSDDSDDSDPEDEEEKQTTAGAKKTDADSSDDSDSSDSDEGAEPKANGAKPAQDASSDSDSDSDAEEEEKPKVESKKRKAADEAEQVPKKAKTDDENATGNLFVGNLSWNVDEEWLTREFEEFGELKGVRIITDRDSGRSKGFGYVEFIDPGHAAAALEAKNGADLDNRQIRIDFSAPRQNKDPQQRSQDRSKKYGDVPNEPSATLFVGNLSFEASEDMVREYFEEHGSINGIRLLTDRETGAPRGIGYVEMGSIDEAKAAYEALQGADLGGRPIRLDYSTPRPPREGGFSDRGGRGGGRGFGGGRGGGGRGGGFRGGRGGFGDRGGRGGGRGGRGGSTNRGGFGDFSGKKVTF